MSITEQEVHLTTHPQFRQIALVVYVGVLIIGIFDWLSGRPPSTLISIDPMVRFGIFCIAILLLILLEVGRQSLLNFQLPLRDPQYLFITLLISSMVLSVSNYFYTQFLFLITILFSELTFQKRIRMITILTTFMLLFLRMALGPRQDFISLADLENLMIFTVAMLLIMMLARLIKRESSQRQRLQQLNDELNASNQQLKSSTEQLAELAVINETGVLEK